MALDLIRRQFKVDVLDIHAGGVDLIFPHHEDEIAQSCAYTGKPEFSRVWMHGEFLNVRGTKMSKRFGNYVTPRDLKADGVDPGAIRLLMYQTHYRQKLDLTDEALAAAAEGARRLGQFGHRLQEAAAEPANGRAASAAMGAAATRLGFAFAAALNDDLNAPRAVGHLFEFVTEVNRLLDAGEWPGPETPSAWTAADSVLAATTPPRILQVAGGAGPAGDGQPSETPPEDGAVRDEWARRWAERRVEAKSKRDFAEADRIRRLLTEHGYEVRDTRGGTEVVRK
jgi:cysteinyl-tRNA synthetase